MRPEVDFKTPSRRVLDMERPERLRDGIDVEHAIFALLLTEPWEATVEMFTIDHAVDDDMTNVDSFGTDFAGQTRRQCPKSRLGGSEGREGGSGAKRSRRTGEENAPRTLGDDPPRGFSTN